MCLSPETIAPRLEKRATYGAAVQELTAAISSASQADQVHRLLPLVSRTHVLVKTRYSGNGQWSVALKCFEAALQACRSHMHDSSVAAFLEPLGGYTKGAQEFLGLQEDTPMEGASAGASTQQHESLLDLLFQPPMPQEVSCWVVTPSSVRVSSICDTHSTNIM